MTSSTPLTFEFWVMMKTCDETTSLISSLLTRPGLRFSDQYRSMSKIIWQVLSNKHSEKCYKANMNPSLQVALHHRLMEEVMFATCVFVGGFSSTHLRSPAHFLTTKNMLLLDFFQLLHPTTNIK
uniref:Uncharacterized protein n=1 Tax=Monopterus albus TaxID=43700 RepID=A0A3Q3Q4F7_MONAL